MFSDYALFTDLDGTLFNSRGKIAPEDRQAIREFVEKGGLFGVSTGRSAFNAGPLLKELPINGWSVVLNGAGAYQYQTKQSRIWNSLDRDVARTIMYWVQENIPEVNVQICTETDMYFVAEENYIDREFWRLHQDMIPAKVSELPETEWLKLLFCAQKPALEKLRIHMDQAGLLKDMDWVYSNPTYLEFLPKGTSKGSCIERLREMGELGDRKIITMGDFYNDIELIRCADVGVAVGNAVPELKAAADVVSCTNDEHAMAWVIRNLIPSLEPVTV